MRFPNGCYRIRLAALAITYMAFGACGSSRQSLPDAAAETPPGSLESTPDPQQAFERNCSVCHSLELPMSQRLDRQNWEAVVDDMVEKYGAKWIRGEQRRIIIDYLVEHYGPDRPRGDG